MHGYNTVAAPLMALTSSKVPPLDTCTQTGFCRAEEQVHVRPHPDHPWPFVVEADASDGVGTILSQHSVVDQKLYVCSFFYR